MEDPTSTPSFDAQLRGFLLESSYSARGAVMTDLDGTVVHEDAGTILIPDSVTRALQQLYELGRPLILNTLRFPLSVIRTFGREWYALAGAPIPLVTLNGSQVGLIRADAQSHLHFDELAAFPLSAAELEEILRGVEAAVAARSADILLFYYPRDWRQGEIIWTPEPARLEAVRAKYLSASAVTAVELGTLRRQLHAQDICMVFLLIEAPGESLMAYQHTHRSGFFTHEAVDKRSGACAIAALLGIDLAHSIGAGDTEMDTFLKAVGLAVLVGNRELRLAGLRQTIRLNSAHELGELLFRVAALQRSLAA
ncbi:MAG: HAD family phosphatase [Gammaproteobacteria bacterium]|nr:HAD family phosphatase [Gammaproteobacteria bacterium]